MGKTYFKYKIFLFLIAIILFIPDINSHASSVNCGPIPKLLPGDIIVRDTNGELASEWDIAWRRIQGKSYRGGHTGISTGDGNVYDVYPGEGMRKVPLSEFLKNSENYYIVTPKVYGIGDNYLKRFAILSDLEKLYDNRTSVSFDETHALQKYIGINEDGSLYYKFDCGGLVEYIFEKNGIDVIPNDMEIFRIPGIYERRSLTPHDYLVSPNVKVCGKYPSHPGGDNPDDFAGVLASNSAFINGSETSGNIGVLANGFFIEMMQLSGGGSLIHPNTLLNPKDYPAIIIPTGGLYGLENSEVFKANLEQYVKNGGMVVALSQQHGYEFSVLPVPQEADGTYKIITGYGWTEDQSCFSNAVYIDTFHNVLAGQTKSTLDVSVDGYFAQYPSDSKILLRRTANGQPAMLLYQYGQGSILVTSLYEDWASTQAQSTQAGRNLIRDIITWAKSPSILPEIKPGETANATVILENNTTADVASAILLLYDPSRGNLVETKTITIALPSGQKVKIPYSYTTASNSPLGIWHIDYLLYDDTGNIISSNVTFDSGRFVVSSPPSDPYAESGLNISITTPSEYIFPGQDVPFIVTLWNNTDKDERLRLYSGWDHIPRAFLDEVLVPAKGSISNNYTIPNPTSGRSLWVDVFSESGLQIRSKAMYHFTDDPWTYAGSYGKGFVIIYPSVDVTVQTDKTLYAKGETVNLTLNLQNTQKVSYTTALKVKVLDPSNNSIYNTTLDINLVGSETSTQNLNFALSSTAQNGYYTVLAEAYDTSGKKIGGDSASFDVPSGLGVRVS